MSFVFICRPQTVRASFECLFVTLIFSIGVFCTRIHESKHSPEEGGNPGVAAWLRVFRSPALDVPWVHKHTAPRSRLLCILQATQPCFPAQRWAEKSTRVLQPPHGLAQGSTHAAQGRGSSWDAAAVFRLDVLYSSSLRCFYETALSRGSFVHLSYEFLIFVVPGSSATWFDQAFRGSITTQIMINSNNENLCLTCLSCLSWIAGQYFTLCKFSIIRGKEQFF